LFSNRVGIPWAGTMGSMMMGQGCSQNLFQSLPESARVCYGLGPRLPNNTHASYTVSDDTEDPVFYSTCFVKKPQWTFDLSLTNSTGVGIVPVPPPWNFGGKCVDCDEWKASQANFNIPRWNLPQNCRNCLNETLDPVPPLPGSLIARGRKCDGDFNQKTVWNYRTVTPACSTKKCVKQIKLVGANDIMPDECIAMASADPECSEFVMHRGNGANMNAPACSCYIKDPCCGTCVPVDVAFSNWEWNIYSTNTPRGDPTCARGVASSDNKYCCSSTCKDPNGVGSCMPKAGLQLTFQGLASVANDGWGVDNGQLLGPRTVAQTAGFTLSSTYGWNCDLTQTTTTGDRSALDGINYHSTYVIPDSNTCTKTPVWTVNVPVGPYQVDTFYDRPNQPIRGCKIQGLSNVDNRTTLGGDDITWVSRTVTADAGTIALSGGTSDGCSNVAAVVIYPKASVQSDTYCQKLPGMCCPLFVDMENRPCATFDPPCKM